MKDIGRMHDLIHMLITLVEEEMTKKIDEVVHRITTDKFHTVGKLWNSSLWNGGSSKREVVDFCVKRQFVTSYYFTI